jgi:DNA-binding response OmpR family regulator
LKILVVEDEAGLREALIDLLTGAGHAVVAAADGEAAVQEAQGASFDLCLLDLMLPRKGGLEVCAELRESRPDTYIVMLTARGAEEDKVQGLRSGADDYVTKPFGARELLARVEAFERRLAERPATAEEIEANGVSINLGRCVARRGEEELSLTAREADILRLLHTHQARAVSRSELLEKVWHSPGDLATRTVDMTIANLRQKIEVDPRQPRIIVTVKGVGYAWGASV